MLPGANAFEISDIQEDETEASQPDDQNVTMLHSLEHRYWKFLRSTGEGNGVAEDSWNAHIGYLEHEVKKIDERADKLEATIPDLENEQKKHVLRELVKHLRDEASEHRKYLALVKQK